MDAHQPVTLKEGDRYPLGPPRFAPVMELVYMPVLEAVFWGFESPLGHQTYARLIQR